MPDYDYLCKTCGFFTETRPMAEYAEPQPCPACSSLAERAILSAPSLAMMDTARRAAFATNERSASAPRRTRDHGSGCVCCTPPRRLTAERVTEKMRSGTRPWMISH